MTKLFSYVLDHDNGFAPNPYGGICTLVHCKFGKNGRKNIIELAEVGDWILGSGGKSKQSAGNGKIIYLMRVDEKLEFKSFLDDLRFDNRFDCYDFGNGNKFALISHHYFYFGKNAIYPPHNISTENLFKKGQGFRKDYSIKSLGILIKWLEKHYEIGMQGNPCNPCIINNSTIKPKMRLIKSSCSKTKKILATPTKHKCSIKKFRNISGSKL